MMIIAFCNDVEDSLHAQGQRFFDVFFGPEITTEEEEIREVFCASTLLHLTHL